MWYLYIKSDTNENKMYLLLKKYLSKGSNLTESDIETIC